MQWLHDRPFKDFDGLRHPCMILRNAGMLELKEHGTFIALQEMVLR